MGFLIKIGESPEQNHKFQSRENCEKSIEYKKPPRGETNKFLLSLFSGDISAIS